MCQAIQTLNQRAVDENNVRIMKNLMQKFNFSFEQAVQATEIPAENLEMFKAKIELGTA